MTSVSKNVCIEKLDNIVNKYKIISKLCQFKAKNSEIKNYALCLGTISKDFTINNMKKAVLKGVVKFFSVDFNPIDTNDILDIHKYLISIYIHKYIIQSAFREAIKNVCLNLLLFISS